MVAAPAADSAPSLPPVESLTIDSDFTAFLQPKVDESVKRQALKRLFADPRFNVMDGLDVYIDDYTKSEPIPPDVLERLMQTFAFNPPRAAKEEPDNPPADASAVDLPEAPAPLPQPAAAFAPESPGASSSGEAAVAAEVPADAPAPSPTPDTPDSSAPR